MDSVDYRQIARFDHALIIAFQVPFQHRATGNIADLVVSLVVTYVEHFIPYRIIWGIQCTFNCCTDIVDVNQKIMEDYFVMTMACDIAESDIPMDKIKKRVDKLAEEMSLVITFQSEKIFKAMHRL